MGRKRGGFGTEGGIEGGFGRIPIRSFGGRFEAASLDRSLRSPDPVLLLLLLLLVVLVFAWEMGGRSEGWEVRSPLRRGGIGRGILNLLRAFWGCLNILEERGGKQSAHLASFSRFFYQCQWGRISSRVSADLVEPRV